MNHEAQVRYSIVIPVYRNEENLEALIGALTEATIPISNELEVVFVVDGSPDTSYELLTEMLGQTNFRSQLVAHSRNFGSFAAIRSGLGVARGDYIAVMAADLQEDPSLMLEFFAHLRSDEVDVVVGRRTGRDDPLLSRVLSSAFWDLYRRTINREIPIGGVDVFGCTREVAHKLVDLGESHSSLVGLLFWIGYRRREVPYRRRQRQAGRSAWSFRKRFRYLLDSVFSFTDLPIIALTRVGVAGCVLTVLAALTVFLARISGGIDSVGYTPLMLVILFSTFTLLSGLGIVGSYVWRTYENSKQRPQAITMQHRYFG